MEQNGTEQTAPLHARHLQTAPLERKESIVFIRLKWAELFQKGLYSSKDPQDPSRGLYSRPKN